MDWTDGQKIKKIPLYGEKMVAYYMKTLDTLIAENSWDDFSGFLSCLEN